tara:strand:+ start:421 stop:630 length:210 start_codon:yes stop_codon:yes gene_type:complete
MNKEKWKITKFWDYVYDKNSEHKNPNSLKKGWNYEVAYWINDDVLNEEYFEDETEAEEYLKECIIREKK